MWRTSTRDKGPRSRGGPPLRRVLPLLLGLLVLALPATVALASNGSGGQSDGRTRAQPNENSQAELTVEFDEDCSGFHVESSKDVSFVSTNADDPPDFSYRKFEGGQIQSEDQDTDADDPDGSDRMDFSFSQDDPYKSIVVKSGSTKQVFDCPGGGGEADPDPGGDPECSDGIDNDEDGQTDHPDDDGCQTPDDDDERPAGDGEGDSCEGAGGDTDEDGVCGDDDQCPDQAGPVDNDGCPDNGGVQNLCTAAAEDPGLPLTEDTLGQTLWDGGLDALSPLTEDPERDGALSGPIGDAGTGTPLEPVTDEAACAVDLLIDSELGGDL